MADVAEGDAVFGSGTDTYAEYAVLTSWARKPDAASFEEVAGYATPFETAVLALDAVNVRPGRTLLVNGALAVSVRPRHRPPSDAASRS